MKSEDINKNVLLPIFFLTSLLSKTHTTKIYQQLVSELFYLAGSVGISVSDCFK